MFCVDEERLSHELEYRAITLHLQKLKSINPLAAAFHICKKQRRKYIRLPFLIKRRCDPAKGGVYKVTILSLFYHVFFFDGALWFSVLSINVTNDRSIFEKNCTKVLNFKNVIL